MTKKTTKPTKKQQTKRQVETDVRLKDGHTIYLDRVRIAQAVVSSLFYLLCSRIDNPTLAKQYKEKIDNLIEEFSPFTFPKQR